MGRHKPNTPRSIRDISSPEIAPEPMIQVPVGRPDRVVDESDVGPLFPILEAQRRRRQGVTTSVHLSFSEILQNAGLDITEE